MTDSSLRTFRPQLAPQQQKLDRETVRRWRSEAITTSSQDRIWPNRCEALCNALLDAQARLEANGG